ncbi:MAG TPA: GTPase ObgE [Candidatus Paceibacterota bacterium]|nr:GTPase ObgE [Candidatus Paceibacterota bacterium]
MLIDDVTIRVKAGRGGDGIASFQKNMMALGPTGGDGGQGGNVYLEGTTDLNALSQFRNTKKLVAGDGERGKGQLNDGRGGDDLVTKVPVGTVIHNLDTGTTAEIITSGQRVLVARGGKGGTGNFKFRSSTNTSPKEFTPGTAGESFRIRLELKLIADVGLVGLPNAGKSSLINELTRAQSRVANYPFTTLEPHLGVYYELVIADIPGLIEGASSGKGLGTKFLRHIERTKIIFHLISAESDDVVRDYATIRKELAMHSGTLADKDEYLFLTKSDTIPPEEIAVKLESLKRLNPNVLPISIHDSDSLDRVRAILNGIKATK